MSNILSKIRILNQHDDLSDSFEDNSHQKKQDNSIKEQRRSKNEQCHLDGVIFAIQLKEHIKEAINDQVKSGLQSSFSYVKPYIKKFYFLKMP